MAKFAFLCFLVQSKIDVNIMQAMAWLSESWSRVSPATIRHCWIKSGIVPDSLELGIRQLDHEGEEPLHATKQRLDASLTALGSKLKWSGQYRLAQAQ